MTTLFASSALLPDGWADDVIVEIDKDGWIVGVDAFKSSPDNLKDAEKVGGVLVPGIPNIHSHAFQRAMAGLVERGSGKKENFWNWRETMYRFQSGLSPKDMEALAAQVYVEMLKSGYTSVGEFHYIHHDPEGRPYPDHAEMSMQMVKAALETGIAITHMPSLYAFGGFGAQAPVETQKRFLNTVSGLMDIINRLHDAYGNTPQVTIGFAPHSLRAVSPDMLLQGVEAFRAISPEGPIHIHAAEQMTEVEDSVKWSGLRPVEWLLANAPVDEKWCLVHCTHMNDAEISGMASAGAVAGLCPTTEANLGDGIFRLVDFFEAGGRFAIGSDSHVTINPFEEMRWLEYMQRLVYRQRTLVRDAEIPSVGAMLMEKVLAGGAQALGRNTGRIEAGYRADFLVLDTELPHMSGKLRDHILDTVIFASGGNPVRDVMAGGKWVIKDRKHKREDHIAQRYREVIAGLK